MQYFAKTCIFERTDCGKIKKRTLKKCFVYFEPVYPNVLYQALNYLKKHKFYEDISPSNGLSNKEMINFSGTGENQDVAASIHKKTTSNETE